MSLKDNQFDVFGSKFAQDIYLQKYSLNQTERWEDTGKRVVEAVCGQLLNSKEKQKIFDIMLTRKFIPGGRYLYSSGRAIHQVNNCFLFRAEDSSEGWADVMQKATAALMSGGGIGFDYSLLRPEGAPIKRKGGFSTGPIAAMEMTNEAGRFIMQGGSRRSAIWAGLNWSHNDINKFLHLKDWPKELRELKEKDLNFRLPMELTNISVIYDTEFFIAIENEDHPKHLEAKKVWLNNCKQAFSSAEPGMSFNFRKDNESLRNACLPGFSLIKLDETTDIKIEDIKEGQDIIVEYKNDKTIFAKVKTKFNNGKKKVYRYGLSELYSVDSMQQLMCTQEHKLLVKDGKDILKITADTCYKEKIPVLTVHGNFVTLTSRQYIGEMDVYDIEVDHPDHSYCIANGIRVSNCTEVVSEDDSDKCNLGTVWMNRCKDKKDFAETVKYATLFLLCGGIYSDVPTQKIREIGIKNNRIGLGLGGMHEWLMLRGHDYECVPELHKWLATYEQESDAMAYIGAKQLSVAIPKGIRAIAPTGSIAILAETTSGIEPLFCKAYKRRYLKDNDWVYQYVVDGSVKRLLDKGVKIDKIKDAYDLSFRQRVKFQADVQNYVDMSISSTCNMPSWGSEKNNEETLEKNADILLKYAKRLRGFTVYPNGARSGQPLTPVDLKEAMEQEGKVFEEKEDNCLGGICGI